MSDLRPVLRVGLEQHRGGRLDLGHIVQLVSIRKQCQLEGQDYSLVLKRQPYKVFAKINIQ